MSVSSRQVDELVGQWARERPDLDLRAMATVARLLTVGRLVEGELAREAQGHGLELAEGDLLFTLRRAGEPYRLTPSALSRALLVSSGTLTSRLDRLEAKGLIERVPNHSDRRSVEIALTPQGRQLADDAVGRHVANEREMLGALSERERASLDRLTAKLLDHLAARPAGRSA